MLLRGVCTVQQGGGMLEVVPIISFSSYAPAYKQYNKISRPIVVPVRHAIFLQKVFDCHLTAVLVAL